MNEVYIVIYKPFDNMANVLIKSGPYMLREDAQVEADSLDADLPQRYRRHVVAITATD